MTRVEFRRFDDRFPPLRELLAVEPDGAFSMWRSRGSAVGRFAGALPDRAGFAALVATAEGEPVPTASRSSHPDGVVDELVVGDRSLSTKPWARGDDAWGRLLDRCRSLLSELVDQPHAAVALVLRHANSGRLEHRGTAPLALELGAASVLVDVYDTATRVAAARAGLPGARHADAGPGWSLDVAIPRVDSPPGTRRVVHVQFVADDEGVLVPVDVVGS